MESVEYSVFIVGPTIAAQRPYCDWLLQGI